MDSERAFTYFFARMRRTWDGEDFVIDAHWPPVAWSRAFEHGPELWFIQPGKPTPNGFIEIYMDDLDMSA